MLALMSFAIRALRNDRMVSMCVVVPTGSAHLNSLTFHSGETVSGMCKNGGSIWQNEP